MTNTINEIRTQLAEKLQLGDIFNGTVEILGASFIADEDVIFGTVSEEYLTKELAWYLSGSLKISHLDNPPPAIWQNIASKDGEINSNYGHLLFDSGQYEEVVTTLGLDQNSRRAVAIYTRPSMHQDWSKDGMQDFVCTNAVHYEIRNNELNLIVQMRSNDAIFGYKNDYTWQRYTQMRMVTDLMRIYPLLKPGTITWQVASFHVYSRHFYLLDHYFNTGEITVSKNNYQGEYGE